MALAGKKVQLKITGDPISFTSETFSTTDDTVYAIDDSTKEIWAPFEPITVYDAGSPVTSGYNLNRLTGQIIFETVGTRDITADGSYLPSNVIGEAYDFTYTLTGNNVDTTTYGSDFIDRTQALIDFTGSITKFTETDDYYFNAIDQAKYLVFEYIPDPLNFDFDIRARVKFASNEKSAAVDGMVEGTTELEGTHDNEGRVVTTAYA